MSIGADVATAFVFVLMKKSTASCQKELHFAYPVLKMKKSMRLCKFIYLD